MQRQKRGKGAAANANKEKERDDVTTPPQSFELNFLIFV